MGQSSPVKEVRLLYLESAENEAFIDKGLALIDQTQAASAREQPVLEAYRGGLLVMRAKHVFWPGTKMKHLREGLPVLDALLEAHQDNSEIRYLRLLSCYYLPNFLGRGWSVEADFKALGKLLPREAHRYPADLYGHMVEFVLSKGNPSPSVRANLQEALAQLEQAPAASENAVSESP